MAHLRQQVAESSKVCALCGELITSDNVNQDKRLSVDHVPPKQFYPKALRKGNNLDLWTVATHRQCNASYKADEEYFMHSLFPLVQKRNPRLGEVLRWEFYRRSEQPQTPALIRSILRFQRTITEGGVYLPPRIVELSVDLARIQRIAVKIAQELCYRDRGLYTPFEKCVHIDIYESAKSVPEFFQYGWALGEDNEKAVLPEVFEYRYCEFDEYLMYFMVFWGAFMISVVFELQRESGQFDA